MTRIQKQKRKTPKRNQRNDRQLLKPVTRPTEKSGIPHTEIWAIGSKRTWGKWVQWLIVMIFSCFSETTFLIIKLIKQAWEWWLSRQRTLSNCLNDGLSWWCWVGKACKGTFDQNFWRFRRTQRELEEEVLLFSLLNLFDLESGKITPRFEKLNDEQMRRRLRCRRRRLCCRRKRLRWKKVHRKWLEPKKSLQLFKRNWLRRFKHSSSLRFSCGQRFYIFLTNLAIIAL